MYRHSHVFAAACLGMLLFGVTLTTLGSVLPSLIDRYGLDRALAGSLLSLMSLGILAGSLVFGPIVDRFGYRSVLLFGALGVMLGLESIAFVSSERLLAVAVFLYGFSGGLINGSTNALVSDISAQERSSGLALLGVFFGIGATSMPVVLGVLLRWLSYGSILAGIGLAVLLALAMFLWVEFPPPKQAQGFPLRRAGALLGEGTLLLLGGMLFFQSGVEITLGGWSAQYAREVLGLNKSQAVLVLSLFSIGMLVARLFLTPLLRVQPPGRVLVTFLAIAIAGAALLIAVPAGRFSEVGLFLLGFGMAAGYPVILAFVGDTYPELTGTAFGIAFVMALIGGSVLPYLTGLLGDRYGLRSALLIVPASVLAMGLLFGIVIRRLPERPVKPSVTPEDEL